MENNKRTAALVAAVAVASSVSALFVVGHTIATTTKAIAIICATDSRLLTKSHSIIRANGRYICGRGLPSPKYAVWKLVDTKGDDLEFFHFHFTSLTRESFNSLVKLDLLNA